MTMTERRYRYFSEDELRETRKELYKNYVDRRTKADEMYEVGAIDEHDSHLEMADSIYESIRQIDAEYGYRRDQRAEDERRKAHVTALREATQSISKSARSMLSMWFSLTGVTDHPAIYLTWEVNGKTYLGESTNGRLTIHTEVTTALSDAKMIVGRHWVLAQGERAPAVRTDTTDS